MKLLNTTLVAILTLLLSCSNDDRQECTINDGQYLGTFTRGNSVTNVALKLENGMFIGATEQSGIARICEGTYELLDNKITFENSCYFTADFDGTLILDGQWHIGCTHNTIQLSKENDYYTLTPQTAPCDHILVEFTNLENEYNCINTNWQMNVNLSNEYRIITNQADFNDLVSGNCMPTIDFSRFDLVIGKKSLTNGLESITYSLEENCLHNRELKVTFNTNLTNEAPNVTYHILMPKMNISNQLSVIQINN